MFTACLLPHSLRESGDAWLANFVGVDCPASSALTREMLGWEPTNIGLIADLDQGHYFDAPAAG